jgi:hypothetical protein
VAGLTGTRDIAVYPAYGDDTPEARVLIEWLMREGAFALDVSLHVGDLLRHETEARVCRALAKALNARLLFSDCSAFPFSYFCAEPDGSITSQLLVRDDEDPERMNVEAMAHDDPRHAYPRVVFAADEALPEREPGAPAHWTHGETSCETAAAGPCRVFAMACPKYRAA